MHYTAHPTPSSSSFFGAGSSGPSSSTTLQGYGLTVSKAFPFPAQFLDFADRNQQLLLASSQSRHRTQVAAQQRQARAKRVLEMYEALVHLGDMPGELDAETVRRWLVNLQAQFLDAVAS